MKLRIIRNSRTYLTCSLILLLEKESITPFNKKLFEEVLNSSVQKIGGELLFFEANKWFVEMEIIYPPKYSISKIVGVMKTRSAVLLKREKVFIKWQRYYIAFTGRNVFEKDIKSFLEKRKPK